MPSDSEVKQRRKFILVLAKALLSFGAPSHRIESQLAAASKILGAEAGQCLLRVCISVILIQSRICPYPESCHRVDP